MNLLLTASIGFLLATLVASLWYRNDVVETSSKDQPCPRITEEGIQCVIPFKYKGSLYSNCVTGHISREEWCPIRVNKKSTFRRSWSLTGVWGKCQPCQEDLSISGRSLRVCVDNASGICSEGKDVFVGVHSQGFTHNTTEEKDGNWAIQCFVFPAMPNGTEIGFRIQNPPKKQPVALGDTFIFLNETQTQVMLGDSSLTLSSSLPVFDGTTRRGDLQITVQMIKTGGNHVSEQGGYRQVFSDIDNTLAPYGTHTTYPGVVQFIHELRGNMDDPQLANVPLLNLVSARPDWIHPKVAQHLVIDGTNIYGGIVGGRPLTALAHDLRGNDMDVITFFKDVKISGLQDFYRDYERDHHVPFIFLGDNGEGDAEAAVHLLKAGYLDGAFIRKVDFANGKDCKLYERIPCTLEHPGLYYFTSYDEAANIAHKEGFLTEKARDRVLAAFESEKEHHLDDCSMAIKILDKFF